MPRRSDSSDDDEEPMLKRKKRNTTLESWTYIQWIFLTGAILFIVLVAFEVASWFVIGYLSYKIDQIPAGPQGIQGATGVAGSSGSLAPILTQYVYVSIGGNDTSGTGQLNNPFFTISKAIALINTLVAAQNSSSVWTIFLLPGVYGGDSFALPANIILQGFDGSAIDSTTVIILNSTAFNVTGSGTLTLKLDSIIFNGKLTLDLTQLTAIGVSPVAVSAKDCKFMAGFAFLGRSTADEYVSRENVYQGNVTINCGTYQMLGDYQFNGDLLVTDTNMEGISATSSIAGLISGGSTIDGSIYIQKTIDATFTQTIESHGSLSTYLLYVNSAIGGTNGNMTLFTDVVSIPFTSSVTGYVTWKNK